MFFFLIMIYNNICFGCISSRPKQMFDRKKKQILSFFFGGGGGYMFLYLPPYGSNFQHFEIKPRVHRILNLRDWTVDSHYPSEKTRNSAFKAKKSTSIVISTY